MRWVFAAALAAGAQSGWAACTVNAQSVNFGVYIQFSNQPTDSAGSVGVTCDAATPYSISLSTGGSANYASRTMTAGGHSMSYNLYADPGHNTIWGDGAAGGSSTVNGSGTSANHPVYGRMAARQDAHVGSYIDSINVTLDF
jgi:spore coat protein U-like protein